MINYVQLVANCVRLLFGAEQVFFTENSWHADMYDIWHLDQWKWNKTAKLSESY